MGLFGGSLESWSPPQGGSSVAAPGPCQRLSCGTQSAWAGGALGWPPGGPGVWALPHPFLMSVLRDCHPLPRSAPHAVMQAGWPHPAGEGAGAQTGFSEWVVGGGQG